MTRGRARRYLLTKQGYYPGVVAAMGYDVWDWSTLNAGTLFQDSAKTTPASANGDVIGCWTDGVGGVDATQTTTANKPGLATASLNGLATLSFDGSDMLATADVSISTFAVFLVANITSNIVYEQSVNSGSNDGMYFYDLGTNFIRINVRRSGTLNFKDNTAATVAEFRAYRHEHDGTGDGHKLAINNVYQTLTADADNLGDVVATAPLFIGARSGITVAATSNIGQLLIVSPYPTDASILVNMESYINGIWGVY